MLNISKDIKFDCAHMLSNYAGKCANLHGHTYHGTVTIYAYHVDSIHKMVLDYNDIKTVVDSYDHAVIVSHRSERDAAEEALLEWAEKFNKKTYIMPDDNPKTTAECLAQDLATRLYALCNGAVTMVKVRLSETDGSWAEAEDGSL